MTDAQITAAQARALQTLLRSLTAKGARPWHKAPRAYDQGYTAACKETARRLRAILADPQAPAQALAAGEGTG